MIDAQFWSEIDPWLYRTAAVCSIVMLMAAVIGLLVKYRKARASGQEVVASMDMAGQPATVHNGGYQDDWKDAIFPCGAISLAVFAAWFFGLTGAWVSQWIPNADATPVAIIASTAVALCAGWFMGAISTSIQMWRVSIPGRTKIALFATATICAAFMGASITPSAYLYSSVSDVMEAAIPLAVGIGAFVIGRWLP